MLKSFLISIFILLCATILESSILSNISFFYVVPDIVLICSIYFALLNGRTFGETTGFFSGLFFPPNFPAKIQPRLNKLLCNSDNYTLNLKYFIKQKTKRLP